MKAPQQLATYRLIITRRNASEVLLLPSGSRWMLPRVETRPFRRLAEELTSEAARAWSVDTYCLLTRSTLSRDPSAEVHCAVLEATRHNDHAPAGSYWMARTIASTRCDLEESQLVTEALAELDCYARGEKAGPFARPGWLRDLFGWTAHQLAPLGLRLTGSFRQFNASPTFALLRLDAAERAVWFKATGEPNAHELEVTSTLARMFPKYLPKVLGVHREWNGWLAAEAEGFCLEENNAFCEWQRAAADLAELQIASIGHVRKLLAAGYEDLRTGALAERIDPFLARMAELMAAQEKSTPAPLAPSEMATLSEALKESCTMLQACGLPDTLGHLDLNPGNILISKNGCVFLDWAEACIANPLLTFEYLHEHMARSGAGAAASRERLLAAYLRPWARLLPIADLTRAAALSPAVAAFAYAAASDAWRSHEQVRERGLTAFYRSLTRRIFREAVEASQRSEPCLR
jgi:hypothetical protein